jgi:alpha-L-fucosidase
MAGNDSQKWRENMNKRWERSEWFREARFGMFIHWGLYAIPARGEWVRSVEKLSNEAYEPYFREFRPDRYDPRAWARAAKAAGQQYAVLTTKHHDGFCLFDSEFTDYKATNTPAQRDLIKEYVEAFRDEGLKVGFYYSLIDWHHDDYPAYGDRIHPMRDNEVYENRSIQFERYVDYLHAQVKELLTNYGKIDVMWFDFSYDDMTGEKWRATELVNLIRSLQPDIIIDNRLGGDIKKSEPEVYAGDFYSPEQIVPPGGIVDENGLNVPWEACITLNDNWGYHAKDFAYKSPKQVVRALVECISKNGNMLLNVGPDARGEIPAESTRILTSVGDWMRRNGESIYGCGASSLPKPEWGRYTQNGNMLYAHVFDRGIGPIYFQGLKGKIKKARLLADGSELKVSTPWMAEHYSDTESGAFIHLTGAELPDDMDTVIALEIYEVAEVNMR